MTAPLTPALALAHLHELSVDVRAAVVLDAAGAPCAGDATLAPRALALLSAAEAVEGVRTAPDGDGTLLVAERPGGGAIALLAGRFALLPLLAHDLAAAAQALAAVRRPGT